MAAKLTNIQDLRTVLGRLNAEQPATLNFQVGRTLYEARGNSFAQRLDLELTSRRGKARVLVTGQIGVGKSSELHHYFDLQRKQPRSPFLIFCDLEKDEHPEKCGATGVLLTIFRDAWAATRSIKHGHHSLGDLRDEILTRLIDWLKGEYSSSEQRILFRFGGMDFPVFTNDANSAVALILGKAAQHEAVSKPQERFGLVPDSLVNLLNRLLGWFAEQCRGGPPILIIDHVDKIRDAAAAEEVLVKASPHWNRINASIVMTAPFEYTLGDLRNSIESKWNRPLMLYPIELPSPRASAVAPIYSNIVRNAGLSGLVEGDSLSLLAHYSGGVLRTFVQFLIQACKEAHLAQHETLHVSDAMSVIQDAERAYQDYSVEDFKFLDEVERRGTGLRAAAVLLRSPIGLLVTDGTGRNEQQLCVHPLAVSSLERYRQQLVRRETA